MAVVANALPPMTIYCDCLSAVRLFASGRLAACNVSSTSADLLKQIFHVEDAWNGGLELRWTEGHATEADVLNGRSTPQLRIVNELADHYAVAGANLARHVVPNNGLVARNVEEKSLYRWLAKLAMCWPVDSNKFDPPAKKKKQKTSDWHLHITVSSV